METLALVPAVTRDRRPFWQLAVFVLPVVLAFSICSNIAQVWDVLRHGDVIQAQGQYIIQLRMELEKSVRQPSRSVEDMVNDLQKELRKGINRIRMDVAYHACILKLHGTPGWIPSLSWSIVCQHVSEFYGL